MAEDVSILSEIDDALRADNLQLMWTRYGRAIIIFCILAVVATAGSVFWKSHETGVHERQTSLLAKAAAAEQQAKNDEAAGYYKQVEDEGGQMAALAGIRHAAVLIAMKQDDQALALYDAVAGGRLGEAPALISDFAKFQAAILKSNQAFRSGTSEKTPLVISNGGGIFHDSMTELGALNAVRAGDTKIAATLFESIVSDEGAPYSQRLRDAELEDSIKGPQTAKDSPVKEHGK